MQGSAVPRQPGPVFMCCICARRPLGSALCFHAIPPACTEKEYFYHWYHFIFAAVCWHQISNISSVREQSLRSTGCKIHNYYLELTSSESGPYWNCSTPKKWLVIVFWGPPTAFPWSSKALFVFNETFFWDQAPSFHASKIILVKVKH